LSQGLQLVTPGTVFEDREAFAHINSLGKRLDRLRLFLIAQLYFSSKSFELDSELAPL
jgi:hypothetical protein